MAWRAGQSLVAEGALAPPIVVAKVGGSLLSLDDLPQRLDQQFGRRGDRRWLVVAGGGPTADLVRDWSRRFPLDESAAHWMACRSLSLNAAMLAEVIPQAAFCVDRVMVDRAWRNGQRAVLDVAAFLMAEERRAEECLPHTWDVTSDSLAAWIALQWPADELRLLKSIGCPTGELITAASQRGLVDPYFPGVAGHLPQVSWCDLRATPAEHSAWLAYGEPLG